MEVIKWQAGPISTLDRAEDISISYLPALCDCLDWGPHHVDLATQNQMRLCYFRRPNSLIDYNHLNIYAERLHDGADVLFWGEPVLGSCLGILWALDALVTRDAPLGHAYLTLSSVRSYRQSLEPEALHQCLEDRIPVEEILEPLLALRRHLASDIRLSPPEISSLPRRIREWVALTDLMTDFLPDKRGLDVVDSLLLNNLTEEWEQGVQVVARTCSQTPPGHEFGDGRLWERLIELAGDTPLNTRGAASWEDALIEIRIEGGMSWNGTHFRISPLGRRVRTGRFEAAFRRPYFRWVGGRLVTNYHPVARAARSRVIGSN